jgi:flagellar protein FliS
LERGNLEEAHAGLVRAQAIVGELLVSLDMEAGGEVASSLAALYTYSTRRLVEANVKKNAEPAQDILRLFRELLPAWQAIANQERTATAPRDAVRVAV